MLADASIDTFLMGLLGALCNLEVSCWSPQEIVEKGDREEGVEKLSLGKE